jgi:hypothetical protein
MERNEKQSRLKGWRLFGFCLGLGASASAGPAASKGGVHTVAKVVIVRPVQVIKGKLDAKSIKNQRRVRPEACPDAVPKAKPQCILITYELE